MWSEAKKCRVCGLKKSFRDAAASSPSSSSHGAQPARSSSQSRPRENNDDAINIRAKHVKDLQKLEAALQQLPPDASDVIKAPLLHEIAAKKKAISSCKPIGHQLEDARGALNRARQRKEKALEEAIAAQHAFVQAENDEERLLNEIAELQSKAADASEPASPTDSLRSALSMVSKSLAQVAANEEITPEKKNIYETLHLSTAAVMEELGFHATKLEPKPPEDQQENMDVQTATKRTSSPSKAGPDGFLRIVKHRCRTKLSFPAQNGNDPYMGEGISVDQPGGEDDEI